MLINPPPLVSLWLS